METVEQLAGELLEAIHAEGTGPAASDHASEITAYALTVENLKTANDVLAKKYSELRTAFIELAGHDYVTSRGL